MLNFKKNDTCYMSQGSTLGKTEKILLNIDSVDDNVVMTSVINNKSFGSGHMLIKKDFLVGMNYKFTFQGLVPCSKFIFNQKVFEIFTGKDNTYPKTYEDITGVIKVNPKNVFSYQGFDFFLYDNNIFEYHTGFSVFSHGKARYINLTNKDFLDSYILKALLLFDQESKEGEKVIDNISEIKKSKGEILAVFINNGERLPLKSKVLEETFVSGFRFVMIKNPVGKGTYSIVEYYSGVMVQKKQSGWTKQDLWIESIKKLNSVNNLKELVTMQEKIN